MKRYQVVPATIRPPGVEAPRRPGPAAVLIAHGMGQQIPFATLDDVAEGLRRADGTRRQTGVLPPAVATTVTLGDERLQRLELRLLLPDGTERDVHVYEAYWAPFTEGRVTLRDVFGFLVRSGLSGISRGGRPFRRWVFGQSRDFRAPFRTVLYLVAALAVVLSLAVLNTIVLAVAAARAPLLEPAQWPSDALFEDVTAILNGLVFVFVAFGAALVAATCLRRPPIVRRIVGAASVAAFIAAVLGTIGAATGAIAAVAYQTRSPGAAVLFAPFTPSPLGIWAWPLVLLASAIVRRFLIQYVGDVAAYVRPQVLDRFYELRQKIKDAVWRTARAVYGAAEYGDVILVGHSLGSVIVYDVLNRLLLDRALGRPDAPEIAARTRLLLTFGSPLDKTAFIFGAQGRRESEAREALAASVQPLIADPRFRPPWVNIYSRWDIISGPLDYYDLPDRSNPRAVTNAVDPEATTLLAAHVEYWKNTALFDTLVRHLVPPPPPSAKPGF